jgi:hypothetical protein
MSELKQYRVRLTQQEIEFLIQAIAKFRESVEEQKNANERELKESNSEIWKWRMEIQKGNTTPATVRALVEAKRRHKAAWYVACKGFPHESICYWLNRRLEGLLKGKRYRSNNWSSRYAFSCVVNPKNL